jgi:hypothetical protein
MANGVIVERFATPQFVISFMLVSLFTGAYVMHPNDGTLNGAIIAAFSAAWGYYIGSSKGTNTQADNLGKVLDLANSPKKVEVTNTEQNPVPVT